ncbi:MAG: glycosyltransferase [bacterium]|nr:glycosyltransferase [bacterium]
MKWLVLGLNYFRHEMREAGDEWIEEPCRSYEGGLRYLPALLDEIKREKGFVPDAIVFGDYSNAPGFYGLEQAPCPTAFVCIDPHCHYDWFSVWSNAWDVVLVAEVDYIPNMRTMAPKSFIEPYPLWGRNDPPPEYVRTIPIAFVGTRNPQTTPDREAMFQAIEKRLPLQVLQGDWREPYARAKIVINQTLQNDLNFRHFEAMSSGAMLITEKIDNGLLDFFQDGVHLVTYGYRNWDELVEKAEYYLTHDEERKRIAKAGMEITITKHSPRVRYRDLCAMVQADVVVARSKQRQQEFVEVRRAESEAFQILAKRFVSEKARDFFHAYSYRARLQDEAFSPEIIAEVMKSVPDKAVAKFVLQKLSTDLQP